MVRREEERKEDERRRRRRRGQEKVRKSSFCMELVWFWVWKLRFLYGLFRLLWIRVNCGLLYEISP